MIVRGFTLQSDRESQQSGLGNCLSKTQVCAKSVKTIYADRRLPNTGRLRGEVSRKAKLLTEAPVNGGPNYEGRALQGPSLNPAVCWNIRESSPTPPQGEVTTGEVRTISRKGLLKGRNPQRLYARDECSKQFTPRAGNV